MEQQNKFDKIEGYFSIYDKVADILDNPKGKFVMMEFSAKLMKGQAPAGMKPNADMMKMAEGLSIMELANVAGGMGMKLEETILQEMNKKLNRIKK